MCEGCNFSYRFKQVYYSMNTTGPQSSPQPYLINVEIKFPMGRVLSWFTPPKKMSAAIMQKQFFEVAIHSRSEKELNYQLRTALSQIIGERPFSLLEGECSEETTALPGLYLNSFGWQRLPNGKMIFVAGDRVIGDCPIDTMINPEISEIHLPLLADFSLGDIVRYLVRGFNQNATVDLVVWAYTLLTSIQSLVLLAGIPLQCVLFVFGGQGVGKSTALKQLFSVYDKSGHSGQQALFFDAGSTMPALRRTLSLFRDAPITIDDLCKASDQETQRQRRKLGGQLIRDCANKVAVMKMNGCSSEEYSVSAGVAITAEFSMDAASELTRTISLHIKRREAYSSPNIRQCAASVLYHFLNWLAPQADNLVSELEEAYKNSQVEISLGKHPRVLTSKFALDWTFHLFCRFCEEVVNVKASNAIKLYENYCSAIEINLVELMKQIEKVDATMKKANIAWHIAQGIDSGEIILCDKKKKLMESHGMETSEKLFFWPDVVYQWIKQQNGYGDYSKIKISKELKSDGILILEYEMASDNTVHLEVKGNRYRFL